MPIKIKPASIRSFVTSRIVVTSDSMLVDYSIIPSISRKSNGIPNVPIICTVPIILVLCKEMVVGIIGIVTIVTIKRYKRRALGIIGHF
jgi:hypothetical protein